MKRIFIILAVSAICLYGSAQQQNGNEKDVALIKKTIQTAYVEGLQNEGDTVKINSGFHPGFELLIPGKDGELKKYPLSLWKANIKNDLASGNLPRKADKMVSVKFLLVDVTGNAAVAKFEFLVGGKLTFVDYQFLYKFGNDWKIVSKIYHKF